MTKAILDFAAEEGPDMLLNLHSHCFHPHILPVSYIPVAAKHRLREYARACYAQMHAAGYATGALPEISADGRKGAAPPFAMNSMLWHTGCDMTVLYG